MTALTQFMRNDRHRSHRKGFTLVELLVVMAIIGILMAILIPVAGIVLTQTKTTAIAYELNQLSTSIENYKNEFSVYPIDMGNPALLNAHILKVSRNHRHGLVFNPNNPNDPSTWFGANLPNPYYDPNNGQPQTRSPQTMDASEAWVFFMSELSKNVDYPLGYRWDGQANQFVYLQGERYSFHTFRDTQFRDYDQDGWREYIQPKGPEIPFVYFEAKSYLRPDPQNPQDIVPNAVNAQALWGRIGGDGIAQPYFEEWQGWSVQSSPTTDWPTKFVNPSSFQLIAAGMDGHFGKPYFRMTAPESKYFWESQKSYLLSKGELDNLSSFAEARLDRDYEQ